MRSPLRRGPSSLTAFLLFASAPALANPSYPQVFFSYSPLFDRECARAREYKIDPKWSREAARRVPEFQSAWDREAPVLLGKLIELTKLDFMRREMTATLSVCDMASMSNPLLLNVRNFLQSYRGERDPFPQYGFVDLVFHELLHTFVVENLPSTTPLLVRYQSETERVKNHLHLMALQKWIYTKLGREESLQWLEFRNAGLGGDYARAWEIVDQVEDHREFVREFKVGHRAEQPVQTMLADDKAVTATLSSFP